jgi:hypothetical protein
MVATPVYRDADGAVVVGVSQATDSKKEAFRKFLETAGVIDMLTKCAWRFCSLPYQHTGGACEHACPPSARWIATGNG